MQRVQVCEEGNRNEVGEGKLKAKEGWGLWERVAGKGRQWASSLKGWAGL
jgi:hypothetical protein